MKKKSLFKIKITYNAPVTLTFCIICTLILLLGSTVLKKYSLIQNFFSVPGSSKSLVPFNFHSPLDYLRLFTHIFGHESFAHLLANFSFILLLGPLLEERYGSVILALMITVTALVTGVLNACLIPSPLMGSSGIAFMMILLASFATIQKNEIPLSFIFVLALYLGKEIFTPNPNGNIATYAHIAGGICGSLFGFLQAPKVRKPRSTSNAFDAKKNTDNDETVIGSINI